MIHCFRLRNKPLAVCCSLSKVHSTLSKLRRFGNARWVCRLSEALIESRQFIGWWRECHHRRSYVAFFILVNAPSAPQISLPSRSGHISPSVVIFLARFWLVFSWDFFVLTSATAVVPRSEVPWSIVAVSRHVLTSRTMTHTVSVLNVWGFHMHARRFKASRKFLSQNSLH